MQYLTPDWPAPAHIKAFTTLRHSWQGRHTTTNSHAVLQDLLQLPEEPIWIKQTHSAIAIEARHENKDQIADASFTHCKNRICAVLTADCLPILICNTQGTFVAAIHAGWRGLAAGIIETTLQSIQTANDDYLVWLGPAIGPNKFEVGQDVYNAFLNAFPESESESGFANLPDKNGEKKWLANLYHLAKIRLKNKGISAIYGGDFCTYTQSDLFFSYRRNKAENGRMASLIWIDGNKW